MRRNPRRFPGRSTNVCDVPFDAERAALVDDPRFFLPAYVGVYGWLGLLLDKKTDWDEVAELLDASYRQVAPKKSLAKLPPL